MADTPDSAAAPSAAPAAVPAAAPEKPFRPTLGWPRGSIRAFLALCVAGSAYWLLANPAMRAAYQGGLPEELVGALLIVIGYYFADRAGAEGLREAGRPPLGLPTGTVRALLIVGFVAAVGWLVYQQWGEGFDFFQLAAAPVILNVGSFLFGRVGKMIISGFATKGRTRAANAIGDIKGIIGLAAGVGTVVVYCFPGLPLPEDIRVKFLELFPMVISFYYGTR